MTDIDDDDLDYDELVADFELDDTIFHTKAREAHPGWFVVKITNYTTGKLLEIDKWLQTSVRFGQFDRLEFRGYCAYSTGVAFESGKDAMLFKLRWC